MSPEITRRRLLATGAAGAAVAATGAALAPFSSAAAATARPAGKDAVKPTIVLVHGGYADSSCWNQTLSYLQGWGYATICGANPLRGIPTDAPYIASLLDSIPGPVADPAWRARPSWYLVTTEDRMIPPAAQRTMSQRAGSTVVEVAASHSIFLSQPAAVAEVIRQAARG